MLEEAAKREKEAEVLQIAVDAMEKYDEAFKELAAIEAAEREQIAEFLDVMAEEAFSNLGEQDFFEPAPKVEPVAIPLAPIVHVAPPPLLTRAPRYILRNETRRRKG
jgi:hypothetical protein